MLVSAATHTLTTSAKVFQPFESEPFNVKGTAPRRTSPSPLQYWPIVVAGGSLLISTVCAIAMGILGNSAMAAVQAVAAITSAITLVYLIYVGPYKKVEAIAALMKERIEQLSKVGLTLFQTQTKMVEHNKNLQKRVDEKAKQVEDTNRKFRETLSNLKTVSGKLLQATQLINTLTDDLESAKKLNDSFSQNLSSLKGSIANLQKAEGRIKDYTKEIKGILDQTTTCQDTLAKQQEQYTIHQQQMQKLLKSVQEIIKETSDLREAKKEQLAQLVQLTEDVNSVLDQVSTRREKVEEDAESAYSDAEEIIQSLSPKPQPKAEKRRFFK